MAITFLEPGGDADFAVTSTNGFWGVGLGVPTIVTDFVHGSHIKSIKLAPNLNQVVITPANIVSVINGRISFYIYINALPTVSSAGFFNLMNTGNNMNVSLRLTTAGVLQLWQGTAGTTYTAQIGTNGTTLTTATWYRISVTHNIFSTSINNFNVFVDGVSTISVTNATITNINSSRYRIGNIETNAALDLRLSDVYVDNSSLLTDTGDIWVTAKRPNTNGSLNEFTTQIGSGGSGYGSGHSPQINERPLDTANGWSTTLSASNIEEYNIESMSTGDIDITGAKIIGYTGWASITHSGVNQMNLIVNSTTFAKNATGTPQIFTEIINSSTYPLGTGTDIGVNSGIAAGTKSLYECGILVAYIPNGAPASTSSAWIAG